MLVYLDHAHLVALENSMKREPSGFAAFVEFWLEHDCRLVISRAHLHEIGQSEEPRDVESKLDLLRYFSLWSPPLDENVDWVLIREIRCQTLQRLGVSPGSESSRYRSVRDELFRPSDQESMRQFVHGSRAGWLDEVRTRRELAGFENRSLKLRQFYEAKFKTKKPKWNPDAWRIASVVQRAAPRLSGDPVADRWMAEVASRLPECWQRAKRERQAKVCMYGIEGMAALKRVPLDELSRMGFYRALGNHWVAPYCERAGYPSDAVWEALNQFDPYEAPAISASLAVERGRRKQEKRFEASDFMDVDHVLWAAHTDLAFVDKRTHGFLAQARKVRKTADLLSPYLDVQIERADTLDDVKRHIRNLATARSAA